MKLSFPGHFTSACLSLCHFRAFYLSAKKQGFEPFNEYGWPLALWQKENCLAYNWKYVRWKCLPICKAGELAKTVNWQANGQQQLNY